ncbi:MAG: DNA polymerase/3'-5' exonuclease PolX [Planctomycetales bacterium]|nr:DNA polymerase/3'-5' exonuclease PolX [Planctomycetales bacterium]
MNNREIAAVFEQVADLLEFQDANPFRVRAYRSGARKIGDLSEPLAEIANDPDRKLTDLDGIGKDLAEKIGVLLETGALPMLDELLEQISPGVLALLRVPGLGPKKAAAIYRELGVENLDQLRQACEQQQIRNLKGFGAKTEETILKGLDIAAQADQRTRWVEADAVVQELDAALRLAPGIARMEWAGSYRRGRETIGDLDVLVDTSDGAAVMDCLQNYSQTADVLVRGPTKMSVRLASGLQVDLRVAPAESFGAALQYFTGSKDHNVRVRGLAKQLGLKVNEWGVFKVGTNEDEGEYFAGRTEDEVYAALGLPCFPPEIREAREEFRWAEQGTLPKLVTLADIRGDLHMHTTASDGKATLDEMVAAARARGLQYIAITDHSQRVSMARGLNADRLRAQWEEIDELRQRVADVQVLKGIECDILEKGGMDLPDDVLAEADWVIASVHYGQNQPREQITQRIVDALANPHVDIVAHPTGRLINRREAYEVDIDAVIEAAAAHGKMLELNANPARLDLNDVHCAAAKRRGVPIVISTDAHSASGLDVMRHGVQQARRGGLAATDVANTLSWSGFCKLRQSLQSE